MDTYQINTYELWYHIIYPIVFLISMVVVTIVITLYLTGIIPRVEVSPMPSIPPMPEIPIEYSTEFHYFGYAFVLVGIISGIYIYVTHKSNTYGESIRSFFDIVLSNFFVQVYLFALISYVIYYIIKTSTTSYASSYTINPKAYEHFDDTPNISKTLAAVENATELLRNSLDTLDNATDDTCIVIKGIEQKFLDNATSPSGDGDPPSKAEAAKIKAQKLPGATKQWNRKLQDWADTHGQIPVVECFTDGSLSDLIDANQQLQDLLASAPVQRVVAQVKRLQTSSLFCQKYMDDLANELTKKTESFANPISEPTLEDTIATSNKLIKQAKDVQAQIKNILASTSELKKNYSALNAKANDPNTVSNLAAA
jgi:hypothetical protein